MNRKRLCLLTIACILSGCIKTKVSQAPPAGEIRAEPGGSAGYQHGVERSKFITGTNRREVSEFGFTKVVGSEGAFAVDASNGAVIAIPNAHSTEQQKLVWYTLGADKHNQQVLDYFVAAGIPRDQIGGVHANTSLYGSGGAEGSWGSGSRPQIAGWQSVLERVVNGVPVIDSVAWARMNDESKIISEWVYWPAIPARTMDEAKRLYAEVSQGDERTGFLSKLPRGLPEGRVVIRHSSAVTGGPFEAFASYDVVERTTIGATDASGGDNRMSTSSIVRHFDIEGKERKLPEEQYLSKADPAAEKRPPVDAAPKR